MKIRDIQKSHNYRESVKKWGAPLSRHRVFIASPLGHAKEREANFDISQKRTVNNPLDDAIYSIDREIERKRTEHDQLKSWISERKSLRQDLKSLGFNQSWYNNKPNKTECETHVHELASKLHKPRVTKPVPVVSKKPRLSEGHVDMLPFLDSPLPIALAIIADYLQDNRLRLVDLFSKVDKNKDWKMTRSELKDSLKNTNIPLKDAHLDELIVTLDVNNDDQLSYKELAMGIDTYRKDRRWQKLKKMYDNLMEGNDDTEEGEETGVDKKRATRLETLQLPRLDTRENISELILQQRFREKRLLKQQKQKSRQRARTRSTLKPIKDNVITTLTGDVGVSKVRYIHFMNEECSRCLDICHSNGMNIKSEGLRNVLVPPYDNPLDVCKAYISCNRSMLPRNHASNIECRKLKRKELKSFTTNSDVVFISDSKSRPIKREESTPIPRVASLDYKNRRKEAKMVRSQRESTSPTAFWPQHLLDKLCLCMDDSGKTDGKNALFNKIT